MSTRTLRTSLLAAALTLAGPGAARGGLIAHWTFDEGAGNVAHDSAGGNHGTLVNGPTWTTGRFGGALAFNGLDQYVDCGNGALGAPLSLTGVFTITAFVRPLPSAAGVAGGTVISKHPDGEFDVTFGDVDGGLGCRRGPAGSGNIGFVGIPPSSGTYYVMAWAPGYVPDESHGYVYDLANSTLYSSSWSCATLAAATTYPVHIGSRPGGGPYFAGIIDEVRIYDETLSEAQILALVPEPTALALLALGGLGLLARRRRRA